MIDTSEHAIDLCIEQYITGEKMDQPIEQLLIAVADERKALQEKLNVRVYNKATKRDT